MFGGFELLLELKPAMAYTLGASSSTLLSHENFHLYCNSLSPGTSFHFGSRKALSFPVKNQRRTPSISISCRVSMQGLIQEGASRDSEVEVRRPGSSGKSPVWVNPKSSKASKLRKKTSDFRYVSLMKVVEALNSCEPTYENVVGAIGVLGNDIVQQDAVFILNNLSKSESARLVLKYFLNKLSDVNSVILYNIAMKILRRSKDMNGVELLFNEMLEKGVKPDNYTFSTMISCARHCSVPEKSIEWFEKMPSFGCEPDAVTLSVMIDAYGKVGKSDVALSLYDRARSEKWRLDAATFATLIRIYGAAGNYDGCLNLYEEMKALRVKPNAGVFNTLLDAMGRAKRPWKAKLIFGDMARNGVEPTYGTYASLIRAYSRARYGRDAIAIYKEMKEKGLEMSNALFNTLLSVCADVGFCDEAFEIFEVMKTSGCVPDSFTFASMITVHSCNGNVEKADATFSEMMEAGFEPNIFVLTSLVQCYGKAGRIDDVVKKFQWMLETGIEPDELFMSCLLSVLSQVPNELEKLTSCIEKVNPKLSYVVKLIASGENTDSEAFKNNVITLLDILSPEVKKAYCNCLIDLCVTVNQLERACELLELGLSLEIYTDIMSRSPIQWSLQLKSLSLGAALTALHIWINDLSKAVGNGEELPPLLGINTGHGKHKFSNKGLAGVFESHLKELNAPFHEATDKVGWFLTTKAAATSWLESRASKELIAA